MPPRVDDPLLALIVKRRFAGHSDFDRLTRAYGNSAQTSQNTFPVDYLFLTEDDDFLPDEVFDRLRWGGQVVLVSRQRSVIEQVAAAYQGWRKEQSDHVAWQVEHELGREKRYFFNIKLIGFRTTLYF